MGDFKWLAIVCTIAFLSGAFFMTKHLSHKVEFYNEYSKLISECEFSIPRNQHCKLKAVPSTDNTK